tara:strand:- start:3218 stop:4075 length:858 start_codon:yes stop_codon:yes gene_type:complete
MAIIYTYPSGPSPLQGDELIVISDVNNNNNTKNITTQAIADLDPDNTLAEVLAAGNSATNNIVLTGNITLTGAQTISTTLDVTGTTTLGVLSLSSISGNWTNAGNTIADLGTVTTADINGGTWQGTIDGSWTAAGQTCADLGTVTTADINGGSIDGTVIGATTDAAGTFTNLVASTLDGIVGSVTPQAGTFTTLTASGNLTVDTNVLHVNATSDNVGIGTASPNAGAILDVQSTTKAFKLPVMSTAQRNTLSSTYGNVKGMLVYDDDTNQMWLNNGSGWLSVDVS